jgi:hypothetical protein
MNLSHSTVVKSNKNTEVEEPQPLYGSKKQQKVFSRISTATSNATQVRK